MVKQTRDLTDKQLTSELLTHFDVTRSFNESGRARNSRLTEIFRELDRRFCHGRFWHESTKTKTIHHASDEALTRELSS